MRVPTQSQSNYLPLEDEIIDHASFLRVFFYLKADVTAIDITTMPVPFGFSVGDFFTLTQLIAKVIRALGDSRGSEHEYQSLVQKLLSLLRAIHLAEETALRCASAHSQDHSLSAPLNGIAREREICCKLIEDFLARSEKYTVPFIHKFGGAKAFKKITWLFHSKDVSDLERDLRAHTDAIHIYICGMGLYVYYAVSLV